MPVRSPIQTLGCSRITIPTTNYKSPVKAVRLRLKKPLESNSLGLMQIQLNGSTQLAELQHNNTTKQHLELLHLWLTLFHQIVILSKEEEGGKDKSTNNKILLEPSLAQQLVQLFLCIHGWPGDDVLQLLYKIMLDIETESVLLGDVLLGDEPSTISVVKIIIDHLLTNQEMASPDKLNLHLAELLYSLFNTNFFF